MSLLLLDADDTLWENNVYFERVIAKFIRFVDHARYSPAEVRQILDDIERANLSLHGYGSQAFGRNLQQAYRRLASHPVTSEQLDFVSRLAASIAEQDLEIIEGVPATLEYLHGRHRLALVTKGSEEEQYAKLQRSGLGRFFSHTEVVREKNEQAYRQLGERLQAPAGDTWMIGNSPRSDINPALAAGLHAVWVPHTNTWVLEHEELQHGPGAGFRSRLIIVSRFSALRDIF